MQPNLRLTPLTIGRDAVEHVLEAAGDDTAQVGRVWVALHRVALAAARLTVRKDGAVESLEDAVCRVARMRRQGKQAAGRSQNSATEQVAGHRSENDGQSTKRECGALQ